MTLDSKLSKAVYQGNGSTTVFPFAFKVWNTSQITVTVTDAAGVSTDVTSNSTVTLTTSGGSVTYPKSGSLLPSGAKLSITRNMPFTQGINLTTASRFDPQVLEDGLDQATAERQQTLEMLARAVILPATSSESPQDVVASIYTARDAAAASANEASAQATAAEGSATAANNSAITAAQTVENAAAEAVADATAQANAAQNAAAAAAQSALDAAAAVPENLVGRVTDVEGVAAASKTITDKATTTPTAGGMPIAGTEKHLALGWFGSMLCNVRTVITVSGTFTAPVSGWYRIMCVGAGGAGGSQSRTNVGAPCGGQAGGDTSFGAFATAKGGAGGGGGRSIGGSGGGAPGEVKTVFVFLTNGQSVTVAIGAGGIISTVAGTAPTGIKPGKNAISTQGNYCAGTGAQGACSGTEGWFDTSGSWAGMGGNGGRNNTGFGGGGGGASGGYGYSGNNLGGVGGDNGLDAADGNGGILGNNGAKGGDGAVIIEYFDPSVTG